ncbi:MAG: hypothetical protein INH41_02920 [Myxococcaceae bacterium]|jgi:hypothetical protein|nr:hypothetical protein [Myxococcaceae bacterium]MCA3011332.1 hypothetical protein [Myxococcaceae bacterium]
MSATPRNARVTLTPVHLVRAGSGLEAVRLRARGFGLVIGSFGARLVVGSLDTIVFHRGAARPCRALFLGLGLGWASARLAPSARLRVPHVERLRAPAPPSPRAGPRVQLRLTVTPPAPADPAAIEGDPHA